MYVDEGLDTGDILLIHRLPIRRHETGGTLHDRLAAAAPAALAEAIALLEAGAAPRIPQDNALATYARKLSREDGEIQWERSCGEIARLIRAMNPWPGAFTLLPDRDGVPRKLKLLRDRAKSPALRPAGRGSAARGARHPRGLRVGLAAAARNPTRGKTPHARPGFPHRQAVSLGRASASADRALRPREPAPRAARQRLLKAHV